jgi:hypothetical protein
MCSVSANPASSSSSQGQNVPSNDASKFAQALDSRQSQSGGGQCGQPSGSRQGGSSHNGGMSGDNCQSGHSNGGQTGNWKNAGHDRAGDDSGNNWRGNTGNTNWGGTAHNNTNRGGDDKGSDKCDCHENSQSNDASQTSQNQTHWSDHSETNQQNEAQWSDHSQHSQHNQNSWHEQQSNSNDSHPSKPPEDCKPIKVAGGSIEGDPHFVGADGSHYDVQGQAGKTYNLLSDKGVQVNGQFDAYGAGGATTIGKLGITAGNSQIEIGKDGSLSVDGDKMAGNGTFAGGAVTKTGNTFNVNVGEYNIKVAATGGYLNVNFASDNAGADGVTPDGLWGVTADGNTTAVTGDKGAGAQGGGVLETAEGQISAAGDKTAVHNYEVGGLFDTGFDSFTNKFGGGQQYGNTNTRPNHNNHRNLNVQGWAA